MLRLIRDLVLVSIVTTVVFMLGVANVLAILFGVIGTVLKASMSPTTYYNYSVGELVAWSFSVCMVLGAVGTFALLWRYGRSDSGPTLRGDIECLRMKWALRGIGKD